ncbi:hypothetical protein, partial [Pseudoalteromonas fuliginea]
IDYGDLENQEAYKSKNNGGPYQVEGPNGTTIQVPEGAYLDSDGYPVANYQDAAADPEKVDQKKFNWLEYYKVKFKADWYTRLYDKL